ncbi:MAG: DNA polymerase III subunit beta [Bacteroidaceae bacterium]
MNFTVSSSAISSRFAAASKVQASKNMIPILDSFLLEVKGDTLIITASDSEKYLTSTLPLISANGEARFCVAAKTIMEPLKDLPEQPLTFDLNTDTFSLKCSHSCGSFVIVAQDANPYPEPVDMTGEIKKLTFTSAELANGVSRCLFATGNDEIRLVMTGVYLDIKADELVFAGTDGRRLVRNTLKGKTNDLVCGLVLPKKVCSVLKTLLPKDDTTVELEFDNERARIVSGDMELRFTLIEGRYPNYNSVIPEGNPYEVIVDRQAFASAVKRVSAFSNQSSMLVRLELSDGNIHISGHDYDNATSAEEHLCCDYHGNPISIGFSGQFLLEIASMLETPSIKLELGDSSRPGVIRPVTDNEDKEDLLMLIMPMRVEENMGGY